MGGDASCHLTCDGCRGPRPMSLRPRPTARKRPGPPAPKRAPATCSRPPRSVPQRLCHLGPSPACLGRSRRSTHTRIRRGSRGCFMALSRPFPKRSSRTVSGFRSFVQGTVWGLFGPTCLERSALRPPCLSGTSCNQCKVPAISAVGNVPRRNAPWATCNGLKAQGGRGGGRARSLYATPSSPPPPPLLSFER